METHPSNREYDQPSTYCPPQRALVAGALFGLVLVGGVGLAFLSVHVSFLIGFGLIVGLGGLLLMAKSPELGLLAIVLFIPLEDFNQVDVFGPFSPIKLLSVFVLGAYLVHYFTTSRQEKLVNVPENAFILAFLLAIMLSNLIAIDPDYAVDKTYKLLRLLVLYFLVINIVKSQAAMVRVFWVMLAAGVFSSGYGLYEYYFHPERLDEMRISGTLDDPMSFAYAMLILLPVVWYLLSRTRSTALRGLLAGVGVLFLYAIILSGTRSAIAAMVGVLVVLAVRQRQMLIHLALVGLVVAGAALFLPENVKSRLGLSDEVDRAAAASTERRITYLEHGLNLFMESPALGYGLGGFAKSYSQSEFRFLQGQEDVRRIAHNMYVEIATGSGLLGLIPFLLLTLSPLVRLQKVIYSGVTRDVRMMAKMLQLSLGAFLFIGLFSSAQFDKPLWLLIGLCTVVPEIAKKMEGEGEE